MWIPNYSRKETEKIYTYYHCTKRKSSYKNITYLHEEKIEETFIKAIEKIKLSPSIIEHTRQALTESSKDEKEFRSNE